MSRTDLKEHGSTIFCQRLQFPLTGFFSYFNQTPGSHAWEIWPFTLSSVSGCLLLLAVCHQHTSSYNVLNIGLERVDFPLTLKKGRGNLYSVLHAWISPEGVQNAGRARRKGRGVQTKEIINGDASQCVHLPCEKNDYLDCLRFPSCSLV